MEIRLLKDGEWFAAIRQPEEVESVYRQIQEHNVLTIPRITVLTDVKDFLKDEFRLVIIESDETIIEKIAYVTSYREISTETITIAENCSVMTREPGEQIKRAEASITL